MNTQMWFDLGLALKVFFIVCGIFGCSVYFYLIFGAVKALRK